MQVQKLTRQNRSKMCYYDQDRYTCGDYTWRNFRQHCNMEYRTGETCGMKLIYQTNDVARKCTTCDEVDRKMRKREKLAANIQRWSREGGKSASIEVAYEDIAEIDEQLKKLYSRLTAARSNIGNSSRPARRYG